MLSFKHTTLPNGLEIVAEIHPHAQSTALGFMVKAGSRDESPELSGVSHFLEHMLFKGTSRRSAEEVNREFDELGARNNAFTSNEVTCYWAQVLPEFFPQALDLLADLMRPALRPSDFDLEKQVILEEIALYLDRPGHVLYEKLMQDHFGAHPMAQSVLGTRESVGALTRPQMMDYFLSRYAPGNLTLAVAGQVDFDELVALASRLCGIWTPGGAAPRPYTPPVYQAKRRALSDPKLKRHYIAALCPGPSAQDPDRFSAQVLCDALGDQEGSRLFWSLVEPGLADEVEFSFYPHDQVGSFMAYASCDPERAEQVEGILLAEIAKVLGEGLTGEEIERSKNKLETGTVLHGELPLGRMRNLASRWTYTREYRTLEEDLAILEGIGPRQIGGLLEKYHLAPMTLTTLGPGPGEVSGG